MGYLDNDIYHSPRDIFSLFSSVFGGEGGAKEDSERLGDCIGIHSSVF